MAFLLDTHTFLWFVVGDKQLPPTVRDKIKDIKQPCFLSVASLWEITIKFQIGKLTLNISLEDLFNYIDRNQIEIIPINIEHLLTLSELPRHHGDPFDRLIISQAIAENLTLITRDSGLKKYKVKQQWK
jgi:PIN domain nuclease of toxin-antitoxin system